MKKLYLLLAFINLFIFTFYGQETKISTADSLLNLGSSFYETNPEKCISLLDHAAIFYNQSDNKKQQAFCYQNIAFAYYEKLENIDNAITYVNKAISIWKDIKAPLKEANLLKYLGMLYGERGSYSKGVETIRQAITLFENNHFKAGIAVSYFNLAVLYDHASKIDSSIYYFKRNKAYFEIKQDTFRIFSVNNKLFESYLKKKNFISAAEIYDYNLSLEKSNRVHWQHLIDYYRISMNFYKLTNNSELYDINQKKYQQLSKKLTEQGRIIK